MYKITKKVKLADQTYMVSLQCPEIAKLIKPGQFVLLRINEHSECISFDYHGGTKKEIRFVFESNDKTKPLVSMKKGNHIFELAGPFGLPSDLKAYTTICLVGKGAGIASIYTLASSIKSRHNRIIAILGAESKKKLFWEDKFDKVADHMFISTEDGSKGRKGTLDLALKDILKKRIDIIYMVADNEVMSQISKMTMHYVKTISRVQVSMLDGLGVTGCDRVFYDNQIRLSSIDGPDFDAHKINWDWMACRDNPFQDKAMIYNTRKK
ncbi:MAG: hypothetical protein QGH47_05915 [Candidatus Woesearchaeota archaeon]|jgi:ferredoxin--NADP+ reductase|nr:hypothetical protein [Candidatus Woesearchaeota archaeon]